MGNDTTKKTPETWESKKMGVNWHLRGARNDLESFNSPLL